MDELQAWAEAQAKMETQSYAEVRADVNAELERAEIITGLAVLLGFLYAVYLIIRAFRKIFHAIKNRKQKRRQKRWERAQRKWSKKQNRTEWDNFRKYGTPSNADFRPTSKPKSGMSPTGWFWDEEKGLWIPPNQLSEESKRRWSWDGEKRIWKDNDKR